MSLFDGTFGGVQTRIIYADEVSEYVKSGLDELDELSMLRLTKLRDPRGESLSKAISLAHSERSRPLGMPFQPPVSTQQFPQLTPAMDNLITTLVWAGVLDGEDMTSMIKSGRTSPAANRPDEGESSCSDRDRVRHADEEAHILYGLSLDTEAKGNSSEVTGAPRRKIGRGGGLLAVRTQERPQRSTQIRTSSPRPGATSTGVIAGTSPSSDIDLGFRPFQTLVERYGQCSEQTEKCLFLIKNVDSAMLQDLKRLSSSLGDLNVAKPLRKFKETLESYKKNHKSYSKHLTKLKQKEIEKFKEKYEKRQRVLLERFNSFAASLNAAKFLFEARQK